MFLDEAFNPIDITTVGEATPLILAVSRGLASSPLSVATYDDGGSLVDGPVPVSMEDWGSPSELFGQVVLGVESLGSTEKSTELLAAPAIGSILAYSESQSSKISDAAIPVARAETVIPMKFDIRFMNRSGTALTATVTGDPSGSGLSQETEILDASHGFAESVRLRIRAVRLDCSDPLQEGCLVPVSKPLKLAEITNPSYTEETGLVYTATNLELGGSHISQGSVQLDASSPLGFPVLEEGECQIELRSMARNPRLPDADPGHNQETVFPFGSNLEVSFRDPIPEIGSATTVFGVSHWIDERTYARRIGLPEQGWSEGENSTVDWFERKVYDFLVDSYEGIPAIDRAVFDSVVSVYEYRPGTIHAAHKTYPWDDRIMMNIHDWSMRYQNFSGSESAYEFSVDLPNDTMNYRIGYNDSFVLDLVHEARHMWQWEQLDVDDQGVRLNDGDNDRLTTSKVATFEEGYDAPYSVEGNPEFNFSGPEQTDEEYSTYLTRERDAMRYEAGFLGLRYECFLVAPTVSIPAGSVATVGSTVTINVSSNIAGQPVQLWVDPSEECLLAALSGPAVIQTNDDRLATFELTASVPVACKVKATVAINLDPNTVPAGSIDCTSAEPSTEYTIVFLE